MAAPSRSLSNSTLKDGGQQDKLALVIARQHSRNADSFGQFVKSDAKSNVNNQRLFH